MNRFLLPLALLGVFLFSPTQAEDNLVVVFPVNPGVQLSGDQAGEPAAPPEPEFAPMQATGGTVTNITVDGADYRVHTFTSSGTFQVTDLGTTDGQVEYLIVAGGGGGGGGRYNGGGGAGGVRMGTINLSNASYSIVVGAGGGGGRPTSDDWDGDENGKNGSNSSAFGITAIGGGGGGGALSTSGVAGNPGGSGGGAGQLGSPVQPGGTATSGQGFAGGSASSSFGGNSSSWITGGGGGGATQAGRQSGLADGVSGSGGNGINVGTMFGTSRGHIINGEAWFAGGGAAGVRAGTNLPQGGNGGGARANPMDQNGRNATANTGGGGSGGSRISGGAPRNGGNGGSGIVIIRYPTEPSN